MYRQDNKTGLIKTSQQRSLLTNASKIYAFKTGALSDAGFSTLANERRLY